MAKTTKNFLFPFPEPKDRADVPKDMEKLAQDIDTKLFARLGQTKGATVLEDGTWNKTGVWTTRPSGFSKPVTLQLRVGTTVELTVTISCQITTPDSSVAGYVGYRVSKPGKTIMEHSPSYSAMFNGYGASSSEATVSRTLHRPMSYVAVGDVITVTLYFYKSGSGTGSVTFQNPTLVASTAG